MESTPDRFRTGVGFDAHRLATGRPFVLGGVPIPHELGLAGHSDGDVLLHAVTDALLGACGLPDIGTRFPDNDPAWKDADSAVLLGEVRNDVAARGWAVVNVDCVVVCDRPRLAPHAAAVRTSLARLLGVPADHVGVKAKTTEGTRLAEPGESVAAFATVLLTRGEPV